MVRSVFDQIRGLIGRNADATGGWQGPGRRGRAVASSVSATRGREDSLILDGVRPGKVIASAMLDKPELLGSSCSCFNSGDARQGGAHPSRPLANPRRVRVGVVIATASCAHLGLNP